MLRSIALAVTALLLPVAPAFAGSLQFWEDSLGSPGITAQFPNGAGLLADIDYDASSAEGGELFFASSEIEILPLGGLSFSDFSCEFSGCGGFFSFTPGGEGVGRILISDPNFDSPITGVFDVGTIDFDILSGTGEILLAGCNYTDGNGGEQTCSPFTLVQVVPEPGTALLLGLGVGALAWLRRLG